MPIAAVPAYLGADFSSASPGLRFGMYLPLWGVNRRTGQWLWSTSDIDHAVRGQQREEREIKVENKTSALLQACKLTSHDKDTMRALAARQAHAAQSTPHVLTRDAIATAPFTTGLGNEHPLENGFAFLNPYGLPYLPGSGVKGVLRQAARELASGEWGESHGWNAEKIHLLERKGKATIELSVIDVLFGREIEGGDSDHVRGALSFWDALPQIPGDSLAVDIMTPHQSHYYQQRQDRKSGDSTSPHDSGAPNPISFLTLPPGTGFAFHVVCDAAHLERLAPDLAHGQRWQALLDAALKHAFAWLGFGAKTAVGYGAMQVNQAALKRREREATELRAQAERDEAERQRLAALATMSPVDRAIRECLDARKDPNLGEIPALKNAIKAGQWQGDMKRDIALRLRDMMQAAKKWKESTQAKKPEKDGDYQDTLLVQSWIAGK
ncbi:MAG: type III-B CRISPR module RAMP protein Cmr6 [Comamonadaceae bacterium]|jgi:CRISPR-associated protein Cmr6|nr:type III-B CRISPR module RAMP protein Cmr6 [Comamonadaceae bacterium]